MPSHSRNVYNSKDVSVVNGPNSRPTEMKSSTVIPQPRRAGATPAPAPVRAFQGNQLGGPAPKPAATTKPAKPEAVKAEAPVAEVPAPVVDEPVEDTVEEIVQETPAETTVQATEPEAAVVDEAESLADDDDDDDDDFDDDNVEEVVADNADDDDDEPTPFK